MVVAQRKYESCAVNADCGDQHLDVPTNRCREEVYEALRARNVSLCVAESERLEVPEVVTALASSLGDIAPVLALVPGRASAAAYGAALLADGLAGGPNADLAEVLRLRESSGTALDHLRVAGAESISLG